MCIKIIYLYPDVDEIINEINLLRIVDNSIKESIVMYSKYNNSEYSVYTINTMTGNIDKVCILKDISELNTFINEFKTDEWKITNLESLELIEKYILKKR
ncbi:MAG: hypothetical protein RR835_04415 [Peptostreptococcaceae bacterium]